MNAEATELLLGSYLKQLRLPAVARAYPALAREAADRNLGYAEFLRALCEQEVLQREQNQLARRLKAAQFPWPKTLDEFDFAAVPGLNKSKLLSLADGRFVRERENAVLVGNPGVGKTHLAVGLGRAACQAGYRVAFRPVPALVNELLAAQHEYRLNRLLKQLRGYDLVVCDEFGYIPFSTEGAQLLFQFFSERYERGSVLVTTNLDFARWTEVFGDRNTVRCRRVGAAAPSGAHHRPHASALRAQLPPAARDR